MTTATLGFKIDSTPASSAAVDLEKLMAAANKLDAAADRLSASIAELGTSLRRSGDAAETAAKPIQRVGQTYREQDDHVRAFRMELERLTAKYQPMTQATKQYEAAVGEINRAHQLGVINAQQMQKALEAERLAYERLKTSATTAGAAIQAANSNNSTAANRAAAVNAGYQFQDTVVTAYMGMNPVMIGMQQGMQLASVVGQMEKPVAGLAAAFASLLSPVSLVTIGLTAGVAALIQYFTTSSEGTDGMTEELRQQNEMIARVAEQWGQATPRIKEYADEAQRIIDLRERRTAADLLARRELEPAVDVVQALRSPFSTMAVDLGTSSEAFRTIQQDVASFNKHLKEGTATEAEFERVNKSIAVALAATGADSVRAFANEWENLANGIRTALGEAQKVRQEGVFHPGMNRSYLSHPGEVYDPDGPIQNPGYTTPEIGPVPVRRPSDLEVRSGEGDGPALILNSDGKLVAVPIPTAKPNYFEREADNPYLSTGRGKTQWDYATLQEELRRNEMKGMFTGFFTDFRSELDRNGGDIGKAFAQSFSNALMNEASKLWDKIFGQIADGLVTALLGSPSEGLLNKKAGFTGVNTTLGSLLGADVAGSAANNNVAGAFSGLAGSSAIPSTDIAAYITQAAVKRGIDPDIALRVAKSEGGLNSWNLQSGFVKNGIREESYGPFQLYKGGGLGNSFMAKTGLDPALAANGPAATDFALDHAAKNGWGAWYGAAKVGVGKWDGIGAGSAAGSLDKLATASTQATSSLGTFGNGLGQIGNSMAGAGGSSASGGGGGLFGWLGGLFGGGSQWNLAKSGKITGMFADGTNYAPGGYAIVGEEGPELVNLPQGSQVFNNNRSKAMLANDNGGSSSAQARSLTVVVQGGNGDNHIRELSRQGAQEAIYQDRIEQERGRFGTTQQTYTKRKG